MEDQVYVCSWSKSKAGFTLWVTARPAIRAQAATYQAAEELLIQAIQRAGGAMVAVMEFDPPLPKSAFDEKYSHPEIVLIGGDGTFCLDYPHWKWRESLAEINERLEWTDPFYERPVCRTCRCASSPRTQRPLELTHLESRYDGAFGRLCGDGGCTHRLVCEDFLKLLTPQERNHLEFQPTIRKGRKPYFELVGPDGPPEVGVAGLEVSGWRCPTCDYRVWGYWHQGSVFNSYVARADLPEVLPGVFTIGVRPEIELACTAARWKELVKQKGSRGFVSRPIGVVADHEVVRRPNLPEFVGRPVGRLLETPTS